MGCDRRRFPTSEIDSDEFRCEVSVCRIAVIFALRIAFCGCSATTMQSLPPLPKVSLHLPFPFSFLFRTKQLALPTSIPVTSRFSMGRCGVYVSASVHSESFWFCTWWPNDAHAGNRGGQGRWRCGVVWGWRWSGLCGLRVLCGRLFGGLCSRRNAVEVLAVGA